MNDDGGAWLSPSEEAALTPDECAAQVRAWAAKYAELTKGQKPLTPKEELKEIARRQQGREKGGRR